MNRAPAILIKFFESLKIEFVFNEKTIAISQVFASDGLLPAIAKRADELALASLGYNLGTVFTESEGMLGNRVSFDESTPSSARLMFLHNVVAEIIASSDDPKRVSLDALIEDC